MQKIGELGSIGSREPVGRKVTFLRQARLGCLWSPGDLWGIGQEILRKFYKIRPKRALG